MVGWGLPYKWDYCTATGGVEGTSAKAADCTAKPAVPADSTTPLYCWHEEAAKRPPTNAVEKNPCWGADGKTKNNNVGYEYPAGNYPYLGTLTGLVTSAKIPSDTGITYQAHPGG